MNRFVVGQKVRVVKSGVPALIGTTVTIMSPLKPSKDPVFTGDLVHETDGRYGGQILVGPPVCFAPIDDDTADIDESLSELLPRTIRDLCSAGDAERAKRKVGA